MNNTGNDCQLFWFCTKSISITYESSEEYGPKPVLNIAQKTCSVLRKYELQLPCKALEAHGFQRNKCCSWKEPRDFWFTPHCKIPKGLKVFSNSDIMPDIRKAILKVRACGMNLVDFLPSMQNMDFQFMKLSHWNFTLNNFALRDRFNIPDGSRDMNIVLLFYACIG